jgi:hypothetical protein
MRTLDDSMRVYHEQMIRGDVPAAYHGLMQYMMGLRTSLSKKYPEYSVSGSLYPGYMDMTYFAFTPPSIRQKGLKTAVVFIHEACAFEAWLAAANRRIQMDYYQLFKTAGWDSESLCAPDIGVDALIQSSLVKAPVFNQPDTLSIQIETGMLEFSEAILAFINLHPLN